MSTTIDRVAQLRACLNGSAVRPHDYTRPLRIGIDLGTAYTVLVVLDANGTPLAGATRFAQVVRDGLVVDFIGAIDLLRELKAEVEQRLGLDLSDHPAATAYPPGVPPAERRATANVVDGAGFHCVGLIDEPTAANQVLQLQDGAIVDVGGGTTGVAVVQDGKVVYTADEATGGTHFTLVIAGALGLEFEAAEQLKTTAAEQQRLLPVVRPVMEKVASITARHLAAHPVAEVHLVGGSCAFVGMAEVVAGYLGLPVRLAGDPLLVTPLGIALAQELENS